MRGLPDKEIDAGIAFFFALKAGLGCFSTADVIDGSHDADPMSMKLELFELLRPEPRADRGPEVGMHTVIRSLRALTAAALRTPTGAEKEHGAA